MEEREDTEGNAPPALNAEVHRQLAGATADIATQLKSITDEMNRMKAELYSSDGGLGSITAELEKIKQSAGGIKGLEGLANTAPSGSDASTLDGARARGDAAVGHAGCCSRGALVAGSRGQTTFRAASQHAPGKEQMGRQDEKKGLGREPQRGGIQGRDYVREGQGREGRRQAVVAQQPTNWVPYVVGGVMLCLGPLRPLLWGLLKDLLKGVLPAGEPDEPAWYDA